jgi:hypothetical protein
LSRQPVVEVDEIEKSVSKACRRLTNAVAVRGRTGRQGRRKISSGIASKITSRFRKKGLGKETDPIRIGMVRNVDHASFQLGK